MAKTLRQLIDNAADRAEIDNLTDGEWAVWINDGRVRLRDELAATSQDYFESTDDTKTTVADQEEYALPDDFLRLLAVEIEDSRGDWITLEPYRHGDRNVLRNADSAYWGYGGYGDRLPRHYGLRGSNLRLLPAPKDAGRTIRMRYMAVPTTLATPATDSISGIEEYFSEYIELWAVLQAKARLESDTLPFERMLTRARDRIRKASAQRDSNAPRVLGSMVRRAGRGRSFRGY
jgi:hypothetical protein